MRNSYKGRLSELNGNVAIIDELASLSFRE